MSCNAPLHFMDFTTTHPQSVFNEAIKNHDIKVTVGLLRDAFGIHPFGKICGNVTIELKSRMKHRGLLIQLEGTCKCHYVTQVASEGPTLAARRNILENEQPIKCIILELLALADDPYVIEAGSVSYPFSLEIPGNPHFPSEFNNSFGSLEYRLVVYIKSAQYPAPNVEVGELTLNFNKGFHNLTENVKALKPIKLKDSFKESAKLSVKKKLVQVSLLVGKSGFLPGEKIPFLLNVENRKLLPLRVSVRLVQRLKYNAYGPEEWVAQKFLVVSRIEKECSQRELRWEECLTSGGEQEPTYILHWMYAVSYSLQFKVKIHDHGVIEGEAPIYIGTTRDSLQILKSYADSLEATRSRSCPGANENQ